MLLLEISSYDVGVVLRPSKCSPHELSRNWSMDCSCRILLSAAGNVNKQVFLNLVPL